MTGGKSALWKDEDIADIITNKAKNFIASHREEPFFLYMGTQDVHVPRIPTHVSQAKADSALVATSSCNWTGPSVKSCTHWTASTSQTTPSSIFTSDNGPVIDDGYQDQAYELLNGHTPMGIYRGGKYSAYEAGTRVPFIVRWYCPSKAEQATSSFLSNRCVCIARLPLDQPLRKGAAPDSQEHLNVLLGKIIQTVSMSFNRISITHLPS